MSLKVPLGSVLESELTQKSRYGMLKAMHMIEVVYLGVKRLIN